MANQSPSSCGEMLFIVFCPVVPNSCLLNIFFGQNILSMFESHLVSKVDRYFMSRSVIRQNSKSHKRVERTQL